MMRVLTFFALAFWLMVPLSLSSSPMKGKIKIGFLIHDLITDRWRMDMENFSKTVAELGGEVVTRNALGSAETQIQQGKELIDQGIKIIAVVAQDGNALAQLVDYANQKGATIIAYDRMILNCNLPYYISFNSIKVGEQMADYALRLRPTGNYVILNGPVTDNNAALVNRGVMKSLEPAVSKGDVNIILNEQMESWNALSTMMFMQDFISTNMDAIDVIITAGDDMVSGVLEVINVDGYPLPVLTGQNASVDACRNILKGYQTMTVYKDIMKLSAEGARLAMKLANKEKVKTTNTTYNGKIEVPSILFDGVVIDKNNLREVLVPKHITEEQLR